LRLGVTDGSAYAEAVGFRLGDASELLAFTRAKVDLAYTVGLDRWNDTTRVQLIVHDLATPGLNLEEVLTDGRLLIERLFARAGDYTTEEPLGLEEAGAFYTKVAGVTFESRQETVRALRPGDPLMLRREPDNPHDPHAVKVVTASGTQIGYLSARIASRLAPSIDTGIRYAAAVTQITGGGDRSFGVNIHVHRHDAPLDEPDPGQALRLSWSGLAADALVERVTVHLHRGRPFREPQPAAIQELLGGRPLRAVGGPGLCRRGCGRLCFWRSANLQWRIMRSTMWRGCWGARCAETSREALPRRKMPCASRRRRSSRIRSRASTCAWWTGEARRTGRRCFSMPGARARRCSTPGSGPRPSTLPPGCANRIRGR